MAEYAVYRFDYELKNGAQYTTGIVGSSQKDAQNELMKRVPGFGKINQVSMEFRVDSISESLVKRIVAGEVAKARAEWEKENSTNKKKVDKKPQEEETKPELSPEGTEHVCAECGFKAKSEAGLATHVKRKHM